MYVTHQHMVGGARGAMGRGVCAGKEGDSPKDPSIALLARLTNRLELNAQGRAILKNQTVLCPHVLSYVLCIIII